MSEAEFLSLSRRGVLHAGTTGLLGLSLPQLLRAAELRDRSATPRADSCILIFLSGGPSQLDMWDLKPEAPAEIRGEFRPIDTNVPGVQFSEHLPRLARVMHLCTLVRSMYHSVNNNHGSAVYTALTGHDRGDSKVATGAAPDDQPAVGSVLSRYRPPTVPAPPYVSLPYITQDGLGGPPVPGVFGGFLGNARDPLFVLNDPNAPDFTIPELTLSPGVDTPRLSLRRTLQQQLDQRLADPLSRSLAGVSGFQEQAFNLLSSTVTQQAFQLSKEPDAVRDGYGRNIYGQSVLLARRLIEAGTRAVCVSWGPHANATWDTHGGNFTKLKHELLPQLDLAVPSLLNDLEARGLLDRTLVAVMGEFGRTPFVNGGSGRDHWNGCYSLLLAGGGLKRGYVHGASDRTTASPSASPLTPADLIATIYTCLGIDPRMEIHDRLGRPIALAPWGQVVGELLG